MTETPYERVKAARDSQRPTGQDYIKHIFNVDIICKHLTLKTVFVIVVAVAVDVKISVFNRLGGVIDFAVLHFNENIHRVGDIILAVTGGEV
jgi:hypothetical protein